MDEYHEYNEVLIEVQSTKNHVTHLEICVYFYF